jgi:6-phosphogluconolactonase
MKTQKTRPVAKGKISLIFFSWQFFKQERRIMASFIYVSLYDDDLIARFDISRGIPGNRSDLKAPGGPGPMVINPQKTRIFTGMRKNNELACMRIEKDAHLSFASRVPLPSDPCFVGTDHGGRYIFSAYYRAGQIAVHRWDDINDNMTEIQRITTEPNAHSVWLDSGDRYVFVPHTGPNKIYLYDFDGKTGTLNSRAWHIPERYLEPRHLCFHPVLDCLYTVNEGSSTVSVYDYNRENGTIKCSQIVSTLPDAGIEGNTTAEIRLSPDGRFLYASNRGHNSISCFAVDRYKGSVELTACAPAPAKPRSFDISPDGHFLYAAGQDSGELASYKIDQDSGRLNELSRAFIGNCPMWVLSVILC